MPDLNLKDLILDNLFELAHLWPGQGWWCTIGIAMLMS